MLFSSVRCDDTGTFLDVWYRKAPWLAPFVVTSSLQLAACFKQLTDDAWYLFTRERLVLWIFEWTIFSFNSPKNIFVSVDRRGYWEDEYEWIDSRIGTSAIDRYHWKYGSIRYANSVCYLFTPLNNGHKTFIYKNESKKLNLCSINNKRKKSHPCGVNKASIEFHRLKPYCNFRREERFRRRPRARWR